MTTYKLIKEVAAIGDKKKLALMEWAGNPAKLNLRYFRDGTPGKGIALTDFEARQLQAALTQYFGEENNNG